MADVIDVAGVRRILDAVTDPEIPVLTIHDIGILRDVAIENGTVVVTITPTYSGCPAMDTIREDITTALNDAGMLDVEVQTVLAPAWTTDWMSEDGRRKLEAYGIAPPRIDESTAIRCPQCRSEESRVVSRFGSTACKALLVCTSCGEPFDHFKEL
ncbi:MAG: phenylacetate-CoA oxygenase subunit PaaJ [Acidimicrobiia bacterium]|nr:phenylacetate-CoA oxygenase subunit PaaJ [Acidimicrobiia bacterium]